MGASVSRCGLARFFDMHFSRELKDKSRKPCPHHNKDLHQAVKNKKLGENRKSKSVVGHEGNQSVGTFGTE